MSIEIYNGSVFSIIQTEGDVPPVWLAKMRFARAMRIERLRNKVKAVYQTRRKITWSGVHADEDA